MADNTVKIAEIRTLLESGVSATTVDGQSVTINHDSLRQELRRLIETDDAATSNMKRPHMSSVNMGGFN